jgi:hypothetical protein
VQVDDHAVAVDAPVVLSDQKALWVVAQPRLEVIARQRRVAKQLVQFLNPIQIGVIRLPYRE